MSNSHVWLNGHELGGRPYGYIGFSFDLTPYLNFGGPNVIAVRLTPEDRSSRWYPGAGIYRNVWIDITGPVHVSRWGTYVTTPKVSDAEAGIAVKTEVRNRLEVDRKITLATSVLDASGKVVSRVSNDATIPARSSMTVAGAVNVPRPQRWDIAHPYLYTLVSEVMDGKTALDRYTTPFGIRTIAFDKDKGFLLNGRYLKIQGVCNHSDLGALGMAVNRRATERQLEIMKAAGVNAIRTSHNPPSPELLDLCDRMGLLVMDETFDMWKISKLPTATAIASTSTNGRSAICATWRGATATTLALSCGASATKSPSRAVPRARRWQAPHRFFPRGRSHAAHHFRLQQLGGSHQE